MAYQIEPAKSFGREIARVACELLEEGTAASNELLEERIHRARTTCKRVRAALRLLRQRHPVLFRRENRRLRDAASGLTSYRDMKAMTAAARLLQPTGRAERATLRALRQRLGARRQAALANKKVIGGHLLAFTRELNASLAVIRKWRPKARRFTAMASEIEKTYRHARRLAKQVDFNASGKKYHEWRKAVKAFGYHCRLLRGAWPEMVKPFAKEANRLGELLGAEHDLTVLAEFVTKTDGKNRRPAVSEPDILKLIGQQQREIRRQAHAIAERLFAEKPRRYVSRLEGWWRCAAKTPGGKSASVS